MGEQNIKMGKVHIEEAGGLFTDFQKKLLAKDPNTLGLVVAVLVGLLTLTLFFLWTKKRIFGRVVLMCGPCDSGKTTILGQLVKGKPLETYTSMKENTGELVVSGKAALTLVDVPGHERIRDNIIEKYAGSARAIIYVVDSATVSKTIRDVTEFLFNILSNPKIHSARPSLLILCNKQDINMAKGPAVIKGWLEKEMNACRLSHSVRLEGTSGEDLEHVFLGKEGKDFAFDDLKIKVAVEESSAQNLDSLQAVQDWIQTVA